MENLKTKTSQLSNLKISSFPYPLVCTKNQDLHNTGTNECRKGIEVNACYQDTDSIQVQKTLTDWYQT